MLPAVLLLSACAGPAPIAGGGEGNETVSALSYVNRDPIMSGTRIRAWHAVGDTDVLIADAGGTLWYGDGVNMQPVTTGVSSFVYGNSKIWLKDFNNNLYEWDLGSSQYQHLVATGVYEVKCGDDGFPYYTKGNSLYGGPAGTYIDTNVATFFPSDEDWVFVLGTDGRLYSWGRSYPNAPWTRNQLVDSNVLAAEPGCFNNQVNGTCYQLVLGTDRKLWFEAGSGHGANPIDTNVYAFQGASRGFVFVEDTGGNLWREDTATGWKDPVDGNVLRFWAPYSAPWDSTVWVQGTDGKLWREHLNPHFQ
jgi:hypothetical protein